MRNIMIVAMDENGLIGTDGKIPWHLPLDFEFFKNITQGATLHMGRKTYESLPDDKLNDRARIVYSYESRDLGVADIEVHSNFSNVREIIAKAKEVNDTDERMFEYLKIDRKWLQNQVYIGGISIYNRFLRGCGIPNREMFVTHVKGTHLYNAEDCAKFDETRQFYFTDKMWDIVTIYDNPRFTLKHYREKT